MIKMINSKLYFPIIIFLGAISRIVSIEYFGDSYIDNEWGVILFNLENNSILGFREIGDKIFPNIFMPPLYPLFLFIIKIINPFDELFIKSVLYIHLAISIIAIIYFRKILLCFFPKNLSDLGALIFSLFPLYVYSVSQISSISLQVFLIVLFFYYFLEIVKKPQFRYLIYFPIISGLLILLRGEFYIIYLLTLIFIYLINKNLKNIAIIFFATLILVSPYLVRNFNIFEKVTITKSFGYNLWKGNNLYSKVEGNEKIYEESMQEKIDSIQPSLKYDLHIDELYKLEALKNIKSDPVRYTLLYFKKFFAFVFIDFDSTYPNYYSLLHIIPKILISITSFLGLIYLLRKKNILNYFSLFYLFNIFLFSIFFILPRYSLILLPVQIILTCYFLKKKLKLNI